MFGAIYGDIIGSYYEIHCTKDYDFPLMQESSFTDDSVMTAAVCQTILNHPEPITRWGIRARAEAYAAQYRQYYAYFPQAGFGRMFATWAKDPNAKCGHSYANGAAMRVVPLGYAYDSLEQIRLQVKASCRPTHRHREAELGAEAVAVSVFLARQGESKAAIRRYVEKHYFPLPTTSMEELRASHVFSCRTSCSVPPAIAVFLASEDYESAVRLAVSLGGDADTEACIAGGIAEAFYGTASIPAHIRTFCEARLDMTIREPIQELAGHLGR